MIKRAFKNKSELVESDYTGCCNDDDIMYNTILNEIEDKIGMSPPLVKSDSFTLRLWEEE